MTTFARLAARGSLLVNDGYRTKSSELGPNGFPILRVAEIGDGRVAPRLEDFIRPDFEDKIGIKLSQPRDVLLTTKGTVGRRAIMPDLGRQFAYSPQLCFFRILDGSVDVRWLYYWLAGPEFWLQAAGLAQQTDMAPYISLRDLRAISISLPPMARQRAIAATLGVLDDKIESNRRVSVLIPELISAHVARSLEGGAQTRPVSGLARFVNGGAFTKHATGRGRMVIRIADLNSGPGRSTVYNELDVRDDQLARFGDLLMSWSGSLGVYRWTRDEAIVNQHIFKVIPAGYPSWLVFERLNYVIGAFQQIAADRATTMGHIKRSHLDSTEVLVPSPDAIDNLDEAIAPLWERLLTAEREILLLERLRDALLPELLSGRIRVSEACETIEETIDEEGPHG